MVGGVGWTTCRDSRYKIHFVLVTQVRAIIGGLLILFISQLGSCALRPPRLLLYCFPLHRQVSWDTTSPLSSTAPKTQTFKGPALSRRAIHPVSYTCYMMLHIRNVFHVRTACTRKNKQHIYTLRQMLAVHDIGEVSHASSA